MPTLRMLCLALGCLILPASVSADGVHIKKVIGLDALVKKSRIILTATIVGTDHEQASRMAYGRDQAYTESFRFKIAVDDVLRGQADKKPTQPGWVSLKGETPPGKWELIEEYYRSTFSPHGAKAGDKIVVFIEQGEIEDLVPKVVFGETLMAYAQEIEPINMLAAVKRELAKAAKAAKKP